MNDDRRATLLTVLVICCFCIDQVFKAVGLAFWLLGKLWNLLEIAVAGINGAFDWISSFVFALAHNAWFTAPWNWLAAFPISSWSAWAQFVPLVVIYGLAELACLKSLLRPLPRWARTAHISAGILTLTWFGLWLGGRVVDDQNVPLWMYTFPMLAALPLLAYSKTLEDGTRLTWTILMIAFLAAAWNEIAEGVAEWWKEKFGKDDDSEDGIRASRPFGDDPRGRLYEVEKAGMLRKQ